MHLSNSRLLVLLLTCLSQSSLEIRAQPSELTSTEIYVSPAGQDTNEGSRSKPFRTVTRAQIEVRKKVAVGLQESIKVSFAQGKYELNQPLVFDVHDSGTADHRIEYAAIPGEDVIFSGGRTIKNWRVSKNGQWQAIVPETDYDGNGFRLLIIDGERAIRARWPNEDGELHLTTVNDQVDKFTVDQPLDFIDLAKQQTELVVYQNWSVTRGRLASHKGNNLMTASPMGWIGHGSATTASPGKAIFLEHAAEFIDQPTEWFFDNASRTVKLLPKKDVSPDSSEIVFPRLKQLVQIRGTDQTPVQNLTFDGIRFEHADFELPEFGYNEIQAAHYGTDLASPTFVQSVAIECTNMVNCRFQNCRFAHLNGSGIGLGAGCRSNKFDRCEIEDIGGNGLMIGWRGAGELEAGIEGDLDADWKNATDSPANNTVSNCRICKCGADSFGGTGIWIGFSRSIKISHNQLFDLPYTGISVGFRWNDVSTSQKDCLVESNHIFDVMQKLADGGGIYTLGFQSNTVFRENFIHDVHRSRFAHGGAPNNGFFIDEGSKGFVFESNVVRSTSGESVRFNNCQRQWHTWQDNHFGLEESAQPAAQRVINLAGPVDQSQTERQPN